MNNQEIASVDSREGAGQTGAFLEWLVQQETLSPVLAERVGGVRAETSDRLAAILLKLGLLSETGLAEAFANYCRLPRLTPAELPAVAVDADLNEVFFRAREVVPLRMTSASLEVACWDALDGYVSTALAFASNRPVLRYVGTRSEISRALDAYYGESTQSGATAVPADSLTET